jgi:hypothetical protein
MQLLSFSTGDQLKNQRTFTDYYTGYGWFGQLTTITTSECYSVKSRQVL